MATIIVQMCVGTPVSPLYNTTDVATNYSITDYFGDNLAEILSKKIKPVYADFDSVNYIKTIRRSANGMGYTQRMKLHATALKQYIPLPYPAAIDILVAILGPENPNETGMFKEYYWVMPIGKFVEMYGLDDVEVSIHAIEEITKRNTGEYCIRPFIRAYPVQTIATMQRWATSDNFHLRRLASEGSRPKLPWATKLNTFVDNPSPVFKILETLIIDDVKFVQRSVANNLADYIKVNKPAAAQFIEQFRGSSNKNTQWIIKHATRKLSV